MDKYKALIGLEMHCEGSETKSKVFSSAKNEYSEIPNSNVVAIDMGFPGILPVVNKEAVRMSIMMASVLHSRIPKYMYFERKNYYYPDLPKGYQITQETKPAPIGIYGELEYECKDEIKKVRIINSYTIVFTKLHFIKSIAISLVSLSILIIFSIILSNLVHILP